MPKLTTEYPVTLHFRVTPELSRRVRETARREGKTVSTWLRDELDAATERGSDRYVMRDAVPRELGATGPDRMATA